MTVDQSELLEHTVDIVASYIGNNSVSGDQLPEIIQLVHKSLSTLNNDPATQEAKLTPAVPIRQSVQPDFIVCLEDGRKLKLLKLHLMKSFNLTPEEYRRKWGLPHDYPIVAPNYARRRSELAKQAGLGTRGKPRKRKQRS